MHPAQLEIIERAYLPTAAELEQARATLAQAESDAPGLLDDGSFVDARWPEARGSPWG